MGNRIPFSTIYFCGNCEEEIVGLPAGERVASHRPLCRRCAEMGQEEGWGRLNENATDPRIYQSDSKRGVASILFLLAVTSVALFAVIAFLGRGTRQ
jgi:hypothetical protein